MEKTKEDLILGYLTNQLALLPSLSKQYTSGKVSRISFLKLKSIAEKFIKTGVGERLVLMPGLRGIGKTTLLFQIYEYIKNIEKETDIIYLSCDNLTKQLNSTLLENIEVYEKKIISEPFETVKKRIVLLIDEAHYDENWQIAVKNVFDRTQNVLMIVSGSCSIAMETNTDLARRMHLERIYPLNLPEYLLLSKNIFPFKGATNDIKEALFESNDLEEAYSKLQIVHDNLLKKVYTKIPNMELELEEFLSKGGITSTLEIKKTEDVFRRINNVLDKVVYQDIVTFYPTVKKCVNRIFPVLHVLAGASDKISYDKLNTIVQEVDSKSIIFDILKALDKAGVIHNLMIEGSQTKMERNSSKYYFASPCIRAALLWSVGKFNKESSTMGLLMENAVYNTLHKIKVYQPNLIQSINYGDSSGDPDFKILTQKGKMLIECGWGRKTSKQVKGKNNERFSLVISETKSPSVDKENNTLHMPRELFLLMG